MNENAIKGAVYGFAYGDAWGKDAEFQKFAELSSLPYLLFPTPALVTDDTQMSLYAMFAVMKEYYENKDSFSGLHLDEKKRNKVRVSFADSFLEFAHDSDNNRAPGMTCMKALGDYELQRNYSPDKSKMTGMEGMIAESKGCGANMRSGWLGLLPFDEDAIINLAVMQSETTHGHPLALASSVMTALTLRAVINGEITPGQECYFDWALDKVNALVGQVFLFRNNSAGEWNPDYGKGLTLLSIFLNNKREKAMAFGDSSYKQDICSFFGEGWVAEEAFLCGLMGADYTTDVVEGLERMVRSNGDSDSIAAIGGQYIGASQGVGAFPPEWEAKLEPRYRDELNQVVEFLIDLQKTA